MTSEELEALEKLWAKASEGPWAYEPIYWAFRMAEKSGNTHIPDDLGEDAKYPTRDDAPRIAALCNAREYLFAAARENAKLRERVEWLEFRSKVLDSTEAEAVQFLTAENARLRAVVEAARVLRSAMLPTPANTDISKGDVMGRYSIRNQLDAVRGLDAALSDLDAKGVE